MSRLTMKLPDELYQALKAAAARIQTRAMTLYGGFSRHLRVRGLLPEMKYAGLQRVLRCHSRGNGR
jgi:hypothetical protein